MSNVLFLMADGFEEAEAIVPFDILIRGGVQVTLASAYDTDYVTSARGLLVKANEKLSAINGDQFDAIFLPGGAGGVAKLSQSELVRQMVQNFDHAGKWIFAICAAPMVLAQSGILKGRLITSYPGMGEDLQKFGAEYSEERVVMEQNILTSRGPGSAEEFGFKILEQLEGKETANRVHAQMVCR